MPTVLNTHDVAQHANPAAKVAYVDNDPVVIAHARAILARDTGVIAMPGDMRDPASILTARRGAALPHRRRRPGRGRYLRQADCARQLHDHFGR